MSPQLTNVGPLLDLLVPVTLQDIPVLSAPWNRLCVENSTQAKGDALLSHDIPVLPGNDESTR
ncbi:hypothetical protein ACIQ7Q_02360 [Streptomyces sp. NPDC096176]|uniref:hypothetical protein n=1 Tax=Streptomyces sp. NPDC096176 TaxID=3366079 RepID=UPI0037FB6594